MKRKLDRTGEVCNWGGHPQKDFGVVSKSRSTTIPTQLDGTHYADDETLARLNWLSRSLKESQASLKALAANYAAQERRAKATEAENQRLRELLTDWCDHAHGIGAKSQAMLVSETGTALGEE